MSIFCGVCPDGDGILLIRPQDHNEKLIKGCFLFHLYHTDSGHYILPTDNFGPVDAVEQKKLYDLLTTYLSDTLYVDIPRGKPVCQSVFKTDVEASELDTCSGDALDKTALVKTGSSFETSDTLDNNTTLPAATAAVPTNPTTRRTSTGIQPPPGLQQLQHDNNDNNNNNDHNCNNDNNHDDASTTAGTTKTLRTMCNAWYAHWKTFKAELWNGNRFPASLDEPTLHKTQQLYGDMTE